ncbi:hypothetical protein OESDEN_24944, partial [Oesophagostomum dentatum]
ITDRKDQKDKREQEPSEEKGGKDKKDDRESEHGADEEYEPGVQFAPVIPLPDLVDVTGEEEKQIVFTARAKQFRSVNETKNNAVSVSRNPKTNCHRGLMHRDQVRNVCALPGSPESPESTDEIFTTKLKTAGIAKEFHDKYIAATAVHPKASK